MDDGWIGWTSFRLSKKNYGTYIVKMKDDPGLEDEVNEINTMPLHFGAFVLSNSKRNTNNFIHAIDGFYTNYL